MKKTLAHLTSCLGRNLTLMNHVSNSFYLLLPFRSKTFLRPSLSTSWTLSRWGLDLREPLPLRGPGPFNLLISSQALALALNFLGPPFSPQVVHFVFLFAPLALFHCRPAYGEPLAITQQIQHEAVLKSPPPKRLVH